MIKIDLRLYIDFDKENQSVHYWGFQPPFRSTKIGYYRYCANKSVRAVFACKLGEDYLEKTSQIPQKYGFVTMLGKTNSIEVTHIINDVSATFEYLMFDEMKTFYAEMVKLFLITT